MKLEITKEELIELYHNQKKSLSEIGKIYDCHAQTVLNKMRKFNIETRSVSEALTGREITWSDKISDTLIGHKISDEDKNKIKESKLKFYKNGGQSWNKGKRKCVDPSITYGKSKEEHWNWKGGVSDELILLRQSSEYKYWRDKVLEKDNSHCICCNSINNLNAHHIQNFENNEDLRFNIDNGATLCSDCHNKFHHIYGKSDNNKNQLDKFIINERKCFIHE